jgi:septum formation protein
MKYILASASPRRRELLEQIGMDFTVFPACGEETMHHTLPEEVVCELSRQKAMEVAERRKGEKEPEVIIGADTVVALEHQILGKPCDEKDAYRMISLLQGRSHKVYTGVTLGIRKQGEVKFHSFYEETEVTMSPMTEQERMRYVETGEPMDKAGGYAIQGKCAVFIEKIHGDYNNVVGLPVAALYHKLRELGMDIEGEIEDGI